MSSYTVRSWVTVGLFGALWAAIEVTLGTYLHAVFPPQANTFLTGVVLGGIGVAVALTGRHFVPNRGSVLLIGVVGGLVAAGGLVFYESSEHFARRIDGFLSPDVDPRTQLGYAANAIQEGGFFGVGVGEGQV